MTGLPEQNSNNRTEEAGKMLQSSNIEEYFEQSLKENVSILHLLIEEHWEEILCHLSCRDFLSLINASPYLRTSDLFRKQMTTRLFPLILPILLSNQYGITIIKDVPSCWATNQGTMQAIRDVLEEEYAPQRDWEMVATLPPTTTSRTTTNGNWNVLRKNLKGGCELFLQIDVRTLSLDVEYPTAPFMGKTCGFCSVSAYNPVTWPVKFLPVMNYLKTWGHNVTIFDFMVTKHINAMYLLLPLMPRLRILSLYTFRDLRDSEECRNPANYPKLSLLETLDVRCCTNDLIPELIRHYGTQFKTLHCNIAMFEEWKRNTCLYTRSLQNVQRLRVCGVKTYSHIIYEILKTERLPKLQELHLSCAEVNHARVVSIQDMQDLANAVAPTLTSLTINMRIKDGGVDVVVNKASTLLLSKLTRFGTLVTNVYSSLFWQFIHRKCGNLEELNFEHDLCWESAEARVCLYDTLQVMAFGVVPNLKRVRVIYNVNDDDSSNQRPPQRLEITRNRKGWKTLAVNEK